MARKLFVNIAVKNLDASVAFFTKLGFPFDPQLTDEHGTCMRVGDDTAFMLLDHERFADFTNKPIVDSATATEAIFAISAESREEVDALVATAISAGGSPSGEKQDHGFMYGWGFQDPDGHLWEVIYMDEAAFAESLASGQE